MRRTVQVIGALAIAAVLAGCGEVTPDSARVTVRPADGTGDTTTGDSPDEAGDSAADTTDPTDDPDESGGADGTAASPYPIGATATMGDYDVTVTGVVYDATDVVMAENQFNDAPSNGAYVRIDTAATYTGADRGQALNFHAEVHQADGQIVSSFDHSVVGPDEFSDQSDVANGGTITGAFYVDATADPSTPVCVVKSFGLDDPVCWAEAVTPAG
ncbi:MAG: hypothetical protein S0880_21675 [Actinomycetota bacterium]|nr:hypothetical protein [Actinomycetota bacterium]